MEGYLHELKVALKIALGYFSKEDHNFAFPSRIVLTMHLSKKLYLSRYIVSSCLTLLGKQRYATLLGKPKKCRAKVITVSGSPHALRS